jgi:hypothetical protein
MHEDEPASIMRATKPGFVHPWVVPLLREHYSCVRTKKNDTPPQQHSAAAADTVPYTDTDSSCKYLIQGLPSTAVSVKIEVIYISK